MIHSRLATGGSFTMGSGNKCKLPFHTLKKKKGETTIPSNMYVIITYQVRSDVADLFLKHNTKNKRFE